MARNRHTEQFLPAFMLLAALCLLLLPAVMHTPNRDSGAFLYVAQRLLDGDILYVDVWDHKPPAIYFLNALGLYLGGGSLWGVWVLELIFLYATLLFGFNTLRIAFGRWPALFGSLVMVVSALPVLSGNMTEEYGLCIQLAALYIFVNRVGCSSYSWPAYLLGSLAALAFLLKPNLIGIWLAICLYLFASDWDNGLKVAARMFVGAAVVVLPVIGYFALEGALGAFWDAVFAYNFAYSGRADLRSRIAAILHGWVIFPVWPIVIASWGGVTAGSFRLRKSDDVRDSLIVLGIILLPIELLLAASSGRTYAHYYTPWLPFIAVFSGLFSYYMLRAGVGHLREGALAMGKPWAMAPTYSRAWLAFFLMTMFLTQSTHTGVIKWWRDLVSGHQEVVHYLRGGVVEGLAQEVADYLRENTRDTDAVLVWGAEGVVNVLANRASPTRYFYQYPLVTSGYTSASLVEGFLREISDNPPRYIVDTGNRFLPPIDHGSRKLWTPPKEWNSAYERPPENIRFFFEFVDNNYEVATQMGGWTIYRWKARMGFEKANKI